LRPAHLAPALVSLIAVSGCALQPPLGTPLERIEPRSGYRFSTRPESRRRDDLLLVVTLSGGGTRAAALGYGVLEQLARDRVWHGGRNKRLLDEVDLISAVSGGSVLAAYHALYGEQVFEHFPRRFLKRNFELYRLRALLSPYNWLRLASARFARGDLYAEFLERKLFPGATFADLETREGPFIVINAADLSIGARFEFTQDRFDVLCLDLAPFPVARAVAASSAVPIAATPIAVRNLAGRCGFEPPAWYRAALEDPAGSPRRHRAAIELQAYLRSDIYRFLHLADGALADNLGVRTAIDALTAVDDADALRETFRLADIRRVAFIVVDAANVLGSRIAQRSSAPSELDIVRLGAIVAVDRYSLESELLLRRMLADWVARLGPDAAQLYYVKVELGAIEDAALRAELEAVPTSLNVASTTVDRLVCAAATILRESESYRRLLLDLDGGSPAAASCGDSEDGAMKPGPSQ
jgi:NTE family protein